MGAMTMRTALASVGLGLWLVACGGAPAGGATVAPAHAAHSAGGEVLRTSGTGQAVSVSANQRFEQAARAMRQHDEAEGARGDWNAGACNDVAGQFEGAANEQPGGAFAEAWFMRGMAFDRCGMTDQARQALQHALQVSHGGNYCRARVQLGVLQYRAHQTAEAVSSFEQAVRDDPNCVEGYTNLAMVQRERAQGNDRLQAVANIRQALARDDKFIPALNQLALTYLAEAGNDPRSQRLMLAEIVCRQAVQVSQQHTGEIAPEVRSFVADVENTWGLINIKVGQIIGALNHFRRAFQLNPNMFEAWVNYGTVNLSFRGYDDAKDAFQHAVQLRPNDYDAHIGLGVALRGLRQNQQAQAEYERAEQLDQNRPDAFYNLAVLYGNYLGDVPNMRRARQYAQQFFARAGGAPRYAEAVDRARRYDRNWRDAIQQLEAVGASSANGAAPQSGGAPATPAEGSAPSGAPAAGAPAGGAPAAPAAGEPARH
jgi:tetratricopeptide (TPR) repeat protein